MTVTIPKDLQDYVQSKVASGQCESEQALIVKAIRVYRDLDERRAQLRSEVQVGLDQLNRGESAPLDIEKIKAEGMKRLADRAQ